MKISTEEIEGLERLLHYLRGHKKGTDYKILVDVIERLKEIIK